MDNCKIIEDLLPSYCDELTSQQSNALVEAHIADCPHCKELLERMRTEPKREILDHREQFRRTVHMYEQAHRVKSLRIWLSVMIALVFVAVIWANSFSLTLLFSGIDKDTMEIVAETVEYDNVTQRIAVVRTSDGDFAIAVFEKNPILNFWTLYRYDATTEEKPFTTYSWFRESSYASYYQIQELKIEFSLSSILIGNNAKAPIVLTSQDIPGDVAVMVNQTGKYYWIHVISDNMDARNSLNLYELMQQKGYVE